MARDSNDDRSVIEKSPKPKKFPIRAPIIKAEIFIRANFKMFSRKRKTIADVRMLKQNAKKSIIKNPLAMRKK